MELRELRLVNTVSILLASVGEQCMIWFDLMHEKRIYCHWLILEVETNTLGVSQDNNLILQNLHIKTSLNWLLNANYDISINIKIFNFS